MRYRKFISFNATWLCTWASTLMDCSGATQFEGKLTWLITGGRLAQKATFFSPGVPPGCVASTDNGDPVQFSANLPDAVGQILSSEAVQPSAARGQGARLPNSALSM